MSISHLRPMGVGEVLDGAFQVYRRNFLVFFLTSLVCMLPFQGASSIALYLDPNANLDLTAIGLILILFILGFPLMILLWPMIAYQVDCGLKQEPVSIKESLVRGLKAVLPLIGAFITAYFVIGLGFFAVMIPLLLVATGIGMVIGEPGILAGVIITVLLVLAFAVLGIISVAWIFAVLPAIVIERLGPIQALKRSFNLAKGGWLKIVAVVGIAYLITYMPAFGVIFLSGTFGMFIDPTAAATFSSTQIAMQSVGSYIVTALTTPFLIACLVLVYYDRRVRTEALDLEITSEALAAKQDA